MSENDIDQTFCSHLGDRIRSARQFRKLTESDLAFRLNPPRKSDDIRNIEAGLADVLAFELNQMSLILNVPLYYFIEDGSLFWFDDRGIVSCPLYGCSQQGSRIHFFSRRRQSLFTFLDLFRRFCTEMKRHKAAARIRLTNFPGKVG